MHIFVFSPIFFLRQISFHELLLFYRELLCRIIETKHALNYHIRNVIFTSQHVFKHTNCIEQLSKEKIDIYIYIYIYLFFSSTYFYAEFSYLAL